MDHNFSPPNYHPEYISGRESHYPLASPQQIVQQQFPEFSLAEFEEFLDSLLLDDPITPPAVPEVVPSDLAPAFRSGSAMSDVASPAGASDNLSSVASTLLPITPSNYDADSPAGWGHASIKTCQDLGGSYMDAIRDSVHEDQDPWPPFVTSGAFGSTPPLGASPSNRPSLGPQNVVYAQPQWQEPGGSAVADAYSDVPLHGDPRASTRSPSTLSSSGAYWGAQPFMVPTQGEASSYLPAAQPDSTYQAERGIEPRLLSSQPAYRLPGAALFQGQETPILPYSRNVASADVPGQGTPSAAFDIQPGPSSSPSSTEVARPTGRKHNKSKMHYCPIPGCSYEDSRTYNVRVHVSRVHHKERPFLCDFPGCNRTEGFSRRENLLAHLEKKHGIPQPPKQERSSKPKKSTRM